MIEVINVEIRRNRDVRAFSFFSDYFVEMDVRGRLTNWPTISETTFIELFLSPKGSIPIL
ncbi:hypothetical protein [Thermococcus sp. 2319x1]|uniref:hypothetical protein n=1 Tax=Thermococcus sp. 2319x1 TaxID=1674923 RepID=UPI0015825B2B|nr:hypothetical protein [Thermococcus sp. 2319x1]